MMYGQYVHVPLFQAPYNYETMYTGLWPEYIPRMPCFRNLDYVLVMLRLLCSLYP